MAETDLIKLYSGRILELAASIPHSGRLDSSDVSVKKRAPLCGSTITVDLSIKGAKVSDFAQNVKACALGQAAASVVGAVIIGCDEAQIQKARNALALMLRENGPTPAPPFEDLEVLRPAAAFQNRHDSILLALDAACEAFEKAREAQSA